MISARSYHASAGVQNWGSRREIGSISSRATELAYPELTLHPILPRFPTRRARVLAIMSVVRDIAPDIVLVARIADAYEAVARLKLAGAAPRLGVAVRGLEAQYVHDVSAYRDFIDACFVDGRLIERACIELAGMDSDRVFQFARRGARAAGAAAAESAQRSSAHWLRRTPRPGRQTRAGSDRTGRTA